MKFKFIENFRILQITQASEVELEQIEMSSTAKWVSFNGKKRESHSKSYLHNYKYLPSGFWHKLLSLRKKKYNVEIENVNELVRNISIEEFTNWSSKLDLTRVPRWYQLKGAWLAIKYRISRGEFATSAGKSFILYLVSRYCVEKLLDLNENILIVVPSVMLVKQLAQDFEDYQKDGFLQMDKIHGGSKRNKGARIVIGNVDALINYDFDFFQQFGAIFYDEAHKLKTSQYQQIIGNYMYNLNLKCIYAVSGTFYGTEDSQDFPAEAISGPILIRIGAKQLMDEGSIAQLKIMVFYMVYPRHISELYYNADDCQVLTKRNKFEMDFIKGQRLRFDFITNIVSNVEFNQLLLFKSLSYCKVFKAYLEKVCPDKQVMMIIGEVDGDERERIKVFTEQNMNCIICASYGTMSTGVSINNLSTLHLIEGSKSFIMVRQSIGRTLRLHSSKKFAKTIDYVDVFKRHNPEWGGPKRSNIAVNHSKHRNKIYTNQEFEWFEKTIDLSTEQSK